MKRQSKPKLKGTVLFTVISVMSLLIIFLTSTLVLAASASNRSHKNYSSSQTEYTARTAIDSVLNAITADENFANDICNISTANPTLSVPVDIQSSSANIASMGRIDDVLVEYAGTKSYFNETTNAWEDKDLLRLTASVTLGGQTSTTSAYLVKDPPQPTSSSGGGAGFVTTGGAKFDCSTDIFGGTYINIPTLAVAQSLNYLDTNKSYLVNYGKSDYDKFKISMTNNPVFEADFVVNGDLEMVASGSGFIIPYAGTGITVWGDFDFGFSGNNLIESVNCDTSATYKFNKIPYLYVDNTVSGNKINIGNNNIPFNVFCGNIDASGNDFSVYSDIYCIDENKDSSINSTGTHLYSWTASVINKTNGTNGQYFAGNIFSMGNLNLGNSTIDKDIRVKGNVNINGNVTVNGDLVVGGTLTVNPGANLNVAGNVYADNVLGYGTPAGLKAGYTEVDNFLHPEEYVVDMPGYERVDNHYYEYTFYEATAQNTATWKWIGAYGEDIDQQKVYYDINGDYRREWEMGTCLYKDDGAGNTIYYYYVACDKYGNEKEQVYFPGKKEIVNNEFYVINSTDPTQMPVPPMVVGHYEPVYWTIADTSGNDTLVVTSDEKSYYRDADGRLVAKAEAMDVSGVSPLSSYGQDIYPEYAKKDVILGLRQLNDASTGAPLNTSETQVVKKMVDILNDVVNPYDISGLPVKFQTDVNNLRTSNTIINDVNELYSVMNQAATDIYDASGKVNIQYTSDKTGKKLPVIDKTCIINMPWGIDASYFPDGERALIINPGSSEICVVIDNLSLQADTKILVDDSMGGKAHIFINDNCTLALQEGTIITTSYYQLAKDGTDFQIYCDSTVAKPGIPVVDIPKLYIYGGVNSTLEMNNFHGITGYVMSPTLNVKVTATSSRIFGSSQQIWYNNYDVTSNANPLLIIGCLNSETTSIPNEVTTLFIPDIGGGTPIPTPSANHWFKILSYDEY